MKKRLLITVFTITAILLSGCSNTTNDMESSYLTGKSMGQIQQAEFILDTSLPDSPEEINFYTIIIPEFTTESVETLGTKLGLTGEAGVISSGTIVLSSEDGNNTLRVYDTGRIEYYSKNGLFVLDADLTSYDDAALIATAFLEETGLWFSDVELEEVKVGGTVNTTPSHLLVQYRQYIDGIPLTGNGTAYAVRVGSGGKVVKATVRHIELEFQRKIQTIGSAEACDSLMAGEGIYFSIPEIASEIIIDNVYLGYFIEPTMETGDDVIPVYVFEGECLASDGTYIEDFTAWIKAAS